MEKILLKVINQNSAHDKESIKAPRFSAEKMDFCY